jgi:RNA polymerase sigma factor (sigma-70 family)
VQDGDIVTAIVAGEPAGLTAAYDRYASALHAYCWSLLAEPIDAADAVQDTFIIAAEKAGGLRDRELLRPWLYALARNECFRRLRAQGMSAPLEAAGDVAVDLPEPGSGLEREELRALVVAALAGLSPGDREVIELNLRHVLDGADLADVLGVSRSQTNALVSRARAQFEGSLGALLTARLGRRSCPELGDILADWDGNLTILLRKRINRHAENCEVCGERKRRELSPAMLLSMLPMVALPPGLRDEVFRVLADNSPGGIGYRDLVVRRAEPFDRSGFPETIDPPGRMVGLRTLSAASTAAVIAAALLGVGTVVTLDALHHKSAPPTISAAAGPTTAAPAPLASGSDRASTPAGTRHHSGSRANGPVTVAQPSPTPSPEPALSQSVPPPQNNQPGPSSSSKPPRPTHTPSSPPPTSPPPSPGTLAASGPVTLTQAAPGGPYTGTFTLTAQGGPVSGFSIIDPAPAGDLSISPSSGGTLSAGQAVTVTVTVASSAGLAFETDLTVDPGALTVVVDYPPAG